MAIESQPVVILDRDGVINRDSDSFIKTPEEWIPIDGSLEAIAALHQAGFLIAVATNQSGIARGLFDEFTLARIHSYMNECVEAEGGQIDGIFYCPHGPDDDCDCRKPKAGLLHEIEAEFGISLLDAPLIGDSRRDLQAGIKVGCRPILVRTGKGESTLAELSDAELAEYRLVDNLAEAAELIIKELS